MPKAKKNKKWTIIGYWDDNQQPWVHWTEGKDEQDALRTTFKELTAENDNGTGPAPDQVWIVGVMEGHQKETGGLDYNTRLADMFEDEWIKHEEEKE